MKKDIKNLNKFTSNFIVSSRGQLDYPGMNTLIPNANGSITMKGVENNVIGIDDLGNKKIMTPEKEYQFPGNSVYEIPLKKRGGQFKKGLINNPKKTKKDLASKKYSRSLNATNVLFTENFLFKKPKSRKNKVFDPNAKYYAEGGESEQKIIFSPREGGCPEGQYWTGTECKIIPKNTKIIYGEEELAKANISKKEQQKLYNQYISRVNNHATIDAAILKKYGKIRAKDKYYKTFESIPKHGFSPMMSYGTGTLIENGLGLGIPSLNESMIGFNEWKQMMDKSSVKPIGFKGHPGGGHFYPIYEKPSNYLLGYNKEEEPIKKEEILNLAFLKPSLIQQQNYQLQGNNLNEEELELPNEEVESEYLEEGSPDTENPMEWVNKRKYDIDWNGIQIPFRLPRFRKPGSYGPLIKKGKQRYINLPTIESRNTAYLKEEKNGGALLTKKVTCKSCGWKWDAADGGNDITTCHKCGGQGLVHAQGGGNTDAMTGMMKSRLAYANEFGNPAAERMINLPDNPYQFDNGNTGSHYMASMDNYAVPQIQDENGVLQLGDYGPESNEAIRFDSDEDANYFAEHYKDVSPGFINEKQYGGLHKFVDGGEPENPPDKVQDLNEVTVYGNQKKIKLQGSLMDRLKQIKKAYNDHRVNLGLEKQKQSAEGTSSIISLKDQIQSYKKELDEEKKSYDKASKALNVLKKYNPESYKKAKVSDVLNATGVDDLRNLYKEGKISDATFMDFYDNFGKSYDREATRTTEEDQVKLEDSWYGQPDEKGRTRWMGNPNNVSKVAQAVAIGAPLAAAAPMMAPAVVSTLANPYVAGGLNAYFAGHGINEFSDPNSLTRKSMSRAYDDPTGSNIGDAAFDVGVNSLNFVGLPFGKTFKELKKYSKPIVKYANNKYTNIAEGSNMFDYAWKSPAARFDKNVKTYDNVGNIILPEMPQSKAIFDKLKTNPNLTAEELAIIKDYEATSINYKTGSDKEKLDAIIKKSGLTVNEPTVMSRRIDASNADNFNPVNGIFNTKRPTSWSAGRDAVGNTDYSGSADRMVMKLQPGEYDMLKNPYLENSPETLDELRKMYEPMGSLEHRMQFVTGKPRITERELLLGSGADLKQIGKVKNNFGGFDYVMKNLNKKQLGSPNVVSSVDDVVKQPWQMEELPGLHLQSTMEGEAISKIVDKTGKINTEQALAIIAKESGGADKVALIKQGLGETIPKKIDFNDFRKITQEQLIPLEKQFSEQASNYGLGKIGYPSPKRSSFKSAIENNKLEIARLEEAIAKNPKVTAQDIDKLSNDREILKLSKKHLLTTEEQFSKLPLENQTLILSNKGKFGTGSSAHGNPEETLGHIHFLRDAQHPDIAIATQMQSDPFQGTHRIMPKVFDKEKELKNLVNLENIAKIQEETAKTAKQISDDIFEFPDGLKIDKTTLENIGKTQKEYNAMKKAEIENFTQKSLLDKNHEERFLQEFMDYAGKRGDLNYIAIPKSETAAKVQGYFKTQKNNANKGDIVTLNNGTTGTIFAKSDNAMVIKHSDGTMENIKLEYVDPKDLFGNMTFPIKNVNGKPFEVHRSYSPEQQTILKKYTEYEKMAKKLGWEIDNITIKGNEYTRIKIPKKFKEGKGEIKAFSTIGTGVLGLGLGATQYKQGGATNDYVDVELTPKEVKDLIAQGYVIEALN